MNMNTDLAFACDEDRQVAESLEQETSRESFFRLWVIRLGIASLIAMTGWGIYLAIVIRRLLQE